jgi:hypothetical protein
MVIVLLLKRAVLLNCRSSSTQGPMSLPSNWKWIETSEWLATEILSTGDVSSEYSFARASDMPQTTAQAEKAMWLIRQGLENHKLELAFRESTNTRGSG